jgi:hypothetical protein
MISVPFEHLIGSRKRIDIPRSCALVIHAITLVSGVTTGAKVRDWQRFHAVVAFGRPIGLQNEWMLADYSPQMRRRDTARRAAQGA